ncbi:hypothetical protein OPKNFCMD_0733 [Methylobacterium crusticola]|uniref:TIGR03067 domain-containing protein n=1 Tax=Methylobacterium crusticola TaxID=1697972 RepID=A0ABQ4QTJ3_9HYPH|nr:hypothetical protein [Methylobacterium crusticola]GJD48019.1 hypothetical protein OPKNFCMD_0733 [Methylobacterium crusticola]
MSTIQERLQGRWRITETKTWDNDYLDLVEPAFIAFAPDGAGEFRFGVVVASLDCADSQTDVGFRFQGSDEGDEVVGEGWAACDGPDTIHGEIAFWNGDETTFKARRWPRS